MKFFSREAGVRWMEWMFLFTLSSREELEALSSFMLLQEGQLSVRETALLHLKWNMANVCPETLCCKKRERKREHRNM